jgi:predicted DNA binding CopG/RHH family protein
MAKKRHIPKIIPVFHSQAEELEFWDTHDSDEYFESTPVDDIIIAIKPEKKKPVTLRLEPSLIDRLKKQAARHDMGYQTLARELLKHSLAESVSRPSFRPAAGIVRPALASATKPKSGKMIVKAKDRGEET